MGHTSVSITAELLTATTSSSSSLFFLSRVSICCRSSGGASVGPAGHSAPAKVSHAGDAGEAGETGDGGDVGEVGDGGERGGDGKSGLTCTSLSRPSLTSESATAARGSDLFSSMAVRFSWGRDAT